MTWYLVVAVFISSCLILAWLGSSLIKSLVQIAKFLRWREFIIASFVMALATSLPNFFVDFNAVFQGLPEIALGDIIGGNLVDLTLVLAIAVFFTKKGLSADSEMVQKSAVFTSAVAVLPLLLMADSRLSRVDGFILILSFWCYAVWLFSERARFTKIYDDNKQMSAQGFKNFLKNLTKAVILIALLLASSQAVVSSAQFFSYKLGISLSLVGILIIGLGNAFPEIYFSIISARKGKNWLILGELMGSIIVCATLVLGIIAFIVPFSITDLSPFLVSRIFLVVAALFALLVIKTGRKILKKEGLLLLFIYIIFLVTEIFIS